MDCRVSFLRPFLSTLPTGGGQMHVYGDQMAEYDLSDSWLMKNSRVHIRTIIKNSISLEEFMGKKTLNPSMWEPYEVPEDFDPAIFNLLGTPLRTGSKAQFVASAPQLCKRRFMQLRASIPSNQLPEYFLSKGGFKMLDRKLFGQSAAEIVSPGWCAYSVCVRLKLIGDYCRQ